MGRGWTPPPPVAEGEEASEPKDIAESIADAKVAVKEGWRRTKQVAAVKIFKAAATDDPEVDAMFNKTKNKTTKRHIRI